jgi:hypothetical protein
MESERLIASLYARRRRLILGLQDFDRRADVYRSAIAQVEAKLQALRPFVAPYRPRRGSQYFTPREFIRGYYDAMRELEHETPTTGDIVIFLMRRKGLDVSDAVLRRSMRRRIAEMRRRMKRRDGPA